MFSLTAEYALRALLWLGQNPEHFQTARAVAEATKIPAHYLTKVLQLLAKLGWVTAHRGIGGGFRIAVDSEKISILEVIEAVEVPLLHRPPAEEPLRQLWSRLRGILAATTLAQLLDPDPRPRPR